jgi:hypothetical protein
MTIGPGTEWSVPGFLPVDAPTFATDASLSEFVHARRRSGEPLPIVGLTGGTLFDTIGGSSVVGRLRTDRARRYPVDIVRADIDGTPRWFVGTLVARTRRWRDAVAVMNTPWVRGLRLGHRAHPGDALLDVVEGAGLRLDDLRRIVPRARHGAHLPHPKLRETRTAGASWEFDRPRRVVIDGQFVGRVRRLAVEVEPDALTVVV